MLALAETVCDAHRQSQTRRAAKKSMTSALTACVPICQAGRAKIRAPNFSAVAKDDRPGDRARDHRRRQRERVEKSGVPLRRALPADDREPKADVPWTR